MIRLLEVTIPLEVYYGDGLNELEFLSLGFGLVFQSNENPPAIDLFPNAVVVVYSSPPVDH